MKKILVLLMLIFLSKNQLLSQTTNNSKQIVYELINSITPKLNVKNKIVFISIWKSDDVISRENNKEFSRVSNIYQSAKLKNGINGVCFININIDSSVLNFRIAYQKDSLNPSNTYTNLSHNYDKLIELLNGKSSIVINSNNEEINQNLNKDNCFIYFRSLITR